MLITQRTLISKTLIILFFISYFIPTFTSYDRMANQWFYLIIISILSSLFIFLDKSVHQKIKFIIKEKEILSYFLFIIWALISILYSFNKPEAIVTFNQYFTVFVCFLVIRILLTNITGAIDFILKIFLFTLLFEVILSIIPILNDIENGTLEYRSIKYLGAAANVNITAYSLLYKTPILLYFFTKEKKLFLRIIYLLAFVSILLIITVLGTRSAFISVGVLVVSYIIYIIQINIKKKYKIQNILFVILSILFIVVISNRISEKGSDFISRASSISINTTDGSVEQRLRYYKTGVNFFLENPLIGTGIGNWKIFSIKYDKTHIDGYIVPYHAHNDLIQLLVELGALGLFLYLLFIFFSIRKLFRFDLFNDKINYLFMGIVGIYFIDSMLNFPIARPISQIFLIFFISLISMYKDKPHA